MLPEPPVLPVSRRRQASIKMMSVPHRSVVNETRLFSPPKQSSLSDALHQPWKHASPRTGRRPRAPDTVKKLRTGETNRVTPRCLDMAPSGALPATVEVESHRQLAFAPRSASAAWHARLLDPPRPFSPGARAGPRLPRGGRMADGRRSRSHCFDFMLCAWSMSEPSPLLLNELLEHLD